MKDTIKVSFLMTLTVDRFRNESIKTTRKEILDALYFAKHGNFHHLSEYIDWLDDGSLELEWYTEVK